ncbi:unnamed protein product, partial [Rotaria socialis]
MKVLEKTELNLKFSFSISHTCITARCDEKFYNGIETIITEREQILFRSVSKHIFI